MMYKSTREVARLLTDFAEFSNQGIVFADLKGTICFANTAWITMHGYAASEEMTGNNINSCHAPRQRVTGMQSFIEEARQKGCFEGVLEHARIDSSLFQAHVKIIILRAAGKEVGYAVFATDLSESQRLEQLIIELKLANQQLQEQVAQLCLAEQSLAQDIDKIIDENSQSNNETHNGDIDEERSDESFVREKPLFDPEKLKSLADLAKRLAVKKESSPAATARIPIKELPAVTPQLKPQPYEIVELIYPPCPSDSFFSGQQEEF
jgi:PAS domain S-box-containing protein